MLFVLPISVVLTRLFQSAIMTPGQPALISPASGIDPLDALLEFHGVPRDLMVGVFKSMHILAKLFLGKSNRQSKRNAAFPAFP